MYVRMSLFTFDHAAAVYAYFEQVLMFYRLKTRRCVNNVSKLEHW